MWVKTIFSLLERYQDIRFVVDGREYCNKKGPMLVACNHQSTWDTMVFYLLADDPAYVMKRELMNIPLFGTCAKLAKMIPVDRSGKDFRKVLGNITRALTENRTVIIFPEGTRVALGETKEYACGVYAIYKTKGISVTPVSLDSGLYWPARRWFSYKPGTIRVRYHEPIAPGLNKSEFMELLRERIEAT